LVTLLLTVFAIWAAFLPNSSLDQKIFDLIAPHISASRTRFMIFISYLGSEYFLIPANVLLLLYFINKKNKWWAIRVVTISSSSLGLMNLLKLLFHRHRPPHSLVDGITNFSFPSGHAFMSVAYYGLLAYWAAAIIKKGWQQQTLIIFYMLIILSISFSRIYLRVHYTTDIIAGLSLGTAWLILSLAVIDKLQARDFDKKK
jgi:undecaprenyl-diphosphatase